MAVRFKDEFEYELAKLAQLRSAIGIPFALLVILGGILATMYEAPWPSAGWQWYVYISFWLAAITAFVGAACLLIAAYWSRRNKWPPSALEQKRYFENLVDWHKNYGGGLLGAQEDFDSWLEEIYAQAAHRNSFLNDLRFELLYRATAATIICAIFTAFASVPFVWHHSIVPPVQRVEIVPSSESCDD